MRTLVETKTFSILYDEEYDRYVVKTDVVTTNFKPAYTKKDLCQKLDDNLTDLCQAVIESCEEKVDKDVLKWFIALLFDFQEQNKILIKEA